MPLGKRLDLQDSNFCGCEIHEHGGEIKASLSKTRQLGFDFMLCPLRLRSRFYEATREGERKESSASFELPSFPSDFQLSSEEWSSMVCGVASFGCPWDYSSCERLSASEIENRAILRKAVSACLEEELQWASHLGLHAVVVRVVEPLYDDRSKSICSEAKDEEDEDMEDGGIRKRVEEMFADCARVVNKHLNSITNTRIWLEFDAIVGKRGEENYRIWQKFRAACAGHENLGILIRNGIFNSSEEEKEDMNDRDDENETKKKKTLACPRDKFPELKIAVTDEIVNSTYTNEHGLCFDNKQISKWFAEPVRCACFDTSCFTMNKHGFPVLPKLAQEFVTGCFKRGIQIILGSNQYTMSANVDCDTPMEVIEEHEKTSTKPEWDNANHPLKNYLRYVAHLFSQVPILSEQECIERDFRDKVQMPLQPLADNLESATYEIFEKDDSKYDAYEDAIELALLDIIEDFRRSDKADNTTIRVAVVGAGRGPLVKATINAAVKANVGDHLKLYVVEKNPNALQTLYHRARSENWSAFSAEIFHADVRFWEAPEKCDVLVSELLGSFGDNELSPECLDGAQRCLKPNAGVSIPQSYTSFIAPMTGAYVHQACSSSISKDLDLKNKETPHVVKLFRHHLLAEPQETFTFSHPRDNFATDDNSRQATLTFKREHKNNSENETIHGFVGYFDALLYRSKYAQAEAFDPPPPRKEVHCSIYPKTHTRDSRTNELMFSWFPIFFPIDIPIDVDVTVEEITVNIWRSVSSAAVWYEWQVVAGCSSSKIHNVSGKSSAVGLH